MGTIIFRQRLLIYLGLWFLAALLLAALPFPDNGYPPLQERLLAFAQVPLLVPLGLAMLFSDSSDLLLLAAGLYLLALGLLTLFEPRRRAFYVLCGIHCLNLAVGVASYSWQVWHQKGG